MITNFYKIVNKSFSVAHFALRNTKLGSEKGKVPKPARIPPQTPPAGGKSAEAGRIKNPRKIVSPCRVHFISFNHLDFARNSFELCPTNTAITDSDYHTPNARAPVFVSVCIQHPQPHTHPEATKCASSYSPIF